MIGLERDGDVFVVTLDAGENRWTTAFVRRFEAVLDEVEASTGPAALVTASADPKFFSNGLDVDWVRGGVEDDGGDPAVFGAECMSLFGRMITLPVPTVCAIGGHAFGAGFMIALCHDVRVMRRDRGFLCANELEIGITIPEPELALFRHKLSMDAFVPTVLHARRWTGEAALAAGVVQELADADAVTATAVRTAAGLAHLGANRTVMGWMKEHLFGENAAINGVHGPAYMLRHSTDFASGPRRSRTG